MDSFKLICSVAAFVALVSTAFALPTVEVSNTSSNGTVFGACEVRATVTAASPSQVAWTSRGVSHVFFDDAAALKTEAYFPVTGTYTLVCTVTDSTGSSSSEMTVSVVQVGAKPIPDIAHYTFKTKTKCYYGTGSGGKIAYLYYPDYFGGKSFEECPFYEGTAGCAYAISAPTATGYFWKMQDFDFTKIGQPSALTVGFWINGDVATNDLTTTTLWAMNTNAGFQLYKGDGADWPYDAEGKRYVQIYWQDESFGTWRWRTTTAVCPTNEWTHVAVAYSRSSPDVTPVIFLNGEAQTISRVSSGKGSQHRGFGSAAVYFCSDSGYLSNGTCYGGRMTDIRLYGWELGEKDIAAVMSTTEKTFAPYVTVVGDSECGPGRELELSAASVETYPADADYSLQWSVVGGDATKVAIGAPTAAQPKVVFSALGDYVLRLVVTAGEKSTTVDHPVHVSYSFLSNAGADQVVTGDATWLSGETVYPNATATDYAVTSAWRQVSGPAAAIESPETPLSAVSLPDEGVYRFELTAVTTLGTYCSTVTVTRVASALGNLPPVLTTATTASNGCVRGSAQLSASAVDPDQSPSASVRIRWFRSSGPGGVFFDNAVAAETCVKFTAIGDYVIGCEASDGDLAVTNLIPLTVEVLGDKQDPDIFLYKLKSASLSCQYDARGRTYTWPNNNPISTDGYFSGTYGFSCPTVSTSVQPINIPTIANPTALVFAAWIKMDDMTNTNGRLIGILNAFYAGVNKSGSGDGKYRLYVGLGNGMSESWTWASDYVLPASGWHHFAAAVVLDENGKGQGKLWLDASPLAIVSAPASSVVIPTISKNSYSHLGNRYSTVVAGSMAFSGVMSDIRFYAHELGDLDIRKLQNEKDFENRAPEIYKTADWPAKMAKKAWYPLPLEAYDDGLPADGEFSATWAVTGGDASKVVFDDEKGVKFLCRGDYELTYTVTDGQYTLVRRILAVIPIKGVMVFFR